VARAFRNEGNGWLSRKMPNARDGRVGPPAGSDVDQLVEVGDEVLDQAPAAVGDQATHARDERPQADRRDDEAAGGIAAERAGRASAEREHPFEFSLAQLRRGAEVVDDLD